MQPRIKKLIALIIMLPALVIYFFAAAALGELVPNNQALKVIYYVFAGILWAWPVRSLIMWANAPKQDVTDVENPGNHQR